MSALERLRPAPPREDGFAAFLVVRNEASRLPHLLDWYRGLGVRRFFAVDNVSTDGTRELLAAQPDVEPYLARGGYADALFGLDWLHALMDRHADGSWCLMIDADELLVWPGAPQGSLPALAARLEEEGAEAMQAVMLDMYPAGPIAEAECRPGVPFLDIAPCFDAGPYWLEPTPGQCPPQTTRGGARVRLFYPELARAAPLRRLRNALRNQMWKLPPLRGTAIERALRDPVPPDLTKIPLVRWRAGLRYRGGPHRIDPVRLAARTAALLHFKFFADSARRAMEEVARGQHYQAGIEYRRYAALLAADPRASFAGPSTIRYAGPEDLVRRGILRGDGAAAGATLPTADGVI